MKFKSSILTAASGSVGGLTYSRNRGGMYTRARSVPVNTQTARRTAARAAFAAVSDAWRTLAGEDQAAWSNYAQSTPVPDTFGDPQVLSGQQMFVRCNMPRVQADDLAGTSLGVIDTAPTTPGFGAAITKVAEIELASDEMTVDVNGTFGVTAGAGDAVLVYVGLPLSTGRSYYIGPYQLAAVITLGTPATTFGNASIENDPAVGLSDRIIAEDDRLPVQLRNASADGRLSQAYREIVTVTKAEGV